MAYLFPCSCGKEIPLEPRQAGEEITCACGVKHTAPTMREIRQLPSTGESEQAPTSTWSMQQGAMFSGGGALVLVGLAALIVLLMMRAQLQTEAPQVDDEAVVEHFEKWLSEPATSLIVWNEFSTLRLPPREYELRWIQQKELAVRNFWQCMLASGIAVVGLLLAVGSIFLPASQSRQRPTRPPPGKKPVAR